MKKLILKPGFEAIFALSLIVILGLPPVLLAQNKKEADDEGEYWGQEDKGCWKDGRRKEIEEDN